jgi:hypothetical protein
MHANRPPLLMMPFVSHLPLCAICTLKPHMEKIRYKNEKKSEESRHERKVMKKKVETYIDSFFK